MWIAVLIVVLAVAMMVGPIMLMQPNKRQRRLARLRSLAVERGMRVRMMRMPDGALRAGETIALYYQAWPGDKPLRVNWMLTRRAFGHGIHFAEDWDWSNRTQAPANWEVALRQVLPQLPASVVAVEATSHSLGLGWLEQSAGKTPEQAIEELGQWLKQLMSELPLASAVRVEPEEIEEPLDGL